MMPRDLFFPFQCLLVLFEDLVNDNIDHTWFSLYKESNSPNCIVSEAFMEEMRFQANSSFLSHRMSRIIVRFPRLLDINSWSQKNSEKITIHSFRCGKKHFQVFLLWNIKILTTILFQHSQLLSSLHTPSWKPGLT